MFLFLLGMPFVLWAGISWTNGTWNSPIDYFNLIGGIAVSACGLGLLAVRRTEIDPVDSISLSSIGMAQSSSTVAGMAAPEKISGTITHTFKADSIPEINVVEDVGGTTAQPPLAFRRGSERVESLIQSASSLLVRESTET